MKYKIKKIENPKFWNDVIVKEDYINILSSWEWIEFERQIGFDTEAYSIENDGVFAFRTIISKKGKYLILRQNTFLDWSNEELVSSFMAFLKLKCIEKGCSFFRLSLPIIESLKNISLLKSYGFKKSVIHHTDAQLTTILDLKKSDNEILKEMRKNTRYLIKKAEKFEIEILHSDDDRYFNDFKKIYDKTVKRHGWDANDLHYIKKQYDIFSSKGFSRIFVARYKGEILASAIFTKFQNQVIYHHSGSVSNNIPAMYLLIWQAIKYYKNAGLKELNFFGVCKKDEFSHPWYGLSLFKRGFGGKERKLMSSYDYPISWKYWFVRSVEKFR